MLKTIPDGVYPTMVTPYTEDNKIDYVALKQLIDWYAERSVAGLFAICQSSEIFFLSFEEKLEILKFIMANKPAEMKIVASGHTADDLDTQIKEAKAYIECGIDAYVFISNRFAKQDENDDVFYRNMMCVIDALPQNTMYGIYECPYPYKRLLSPKLIAKMANSGKFAFLKDTCCNLEQIKDKLAAAKGTNFKIYNANAALLYDSLIAGCAGYSGVMANFHPEIYAELCDCYKTNPEKAQILSDFVGFASVCECQVYPINAKYYISLDGVKINKFSRSRSINDFPPNRQKEIEQLYGFTKYFKKNMEIK